MSDPHYGQEDKRRTAPVLGRLIALMGPVVGERSGPWFDADDAANMLKERVATVQSKGREVNDKHHRHLGLRWERRRKAGGPPGAHEYRLTKVEPEQLPLLEGASANP